MHPQIIRANIALFQGKRAETQRLIEDYLAELEDPQAARRDPLVLWLDAQARAQHTERLDGLRALIEQTPPDNPYHRMAQAYLHDEDRYTGLLNSMGQGFRPSRWQIIAGLVLLAVVAAAVILFSQQEAPAPPPTVEIAAEDTPVPTATVIVQNTPIAFGDGAPLQAEYDPLDGILTVLSYDPALRHVVNAQGETVEPLEGTTFYGLELEFRCLLPVCNDVPEAELFARLNDGSRMRASDLRVAGQPTLEGGIGRGFTVRGWVVFQLPRNERPAELVIWQRPNAGSEERPPEILVPLPQ